MRSRSLYIWDLWHDMVTTCRQRPQAAGRLSQRPRHLMSSCCPGNWPAPATPPCYRPVVPTLGTLGPAPPGPAGPGAPGQGCWQLLAISARIWARGLCLARSVETIAAHPWWRERERERGYWQVAPLNPDRLNVTSDWPDLYLRGNLVTLLILNSFLDRRFQCGSHVWCIVIILDQHNILALYSVSWVGCGCGDNGQVQVSLVVTVCLGPSWVNTRQCDCLSVMIIRCQSVSPSVKMSNFNITTWHDINIYPVS